MANQTTVSQYLPDGRPTLDIDTSKTLAITDCGVVQNVIADAITVTLPATTAGFTFTIRNGGVKKSGGPRGTGDDGSVLITIAPQALDYVAGGTWTATDAKKIFNTKVTAKVGDEITVNADGTNGYFVTRQVGVWAREA